MTSKSFILGIIVYLVAAGASYYLFTSNFIQGGLTSAPPPLKTKTGQLLFDASLPKTEACPTNGAMYSKQQRAWWEKHAPLGVMIENHENARPQSGISSADVVYEAVAEGAITRFLVIFYCQDAPTVGPVRSARTYFVDFVSEYGVNPLYTHVGGANTDGPANALGQIDDYGWGGYNDMNQFSVGFPTFWRDYNRLGHATETEHTMYSTTTKLWDFAKTRGLTNVNKDGVAWDKNFVPYTFKDDASLSGRGPSQTIHIEFWEGYHAYFVDWKYDPKTNLYARNNGGQPHIDRNTNKQLTAKNIVILSMQESHADDGYENDAHLLYKDKGTGKAVVFQDGKKIPATWSKASRTDRLTLKDASGNQIKFDRGLIWFEILPLDGVYTVK